MKSRHKPLLLSLVAFSISHTAHAADGTWATDANGLWSISENWAAGIADGDTSTASFTNDITADRTVSLDSPRALNKLVFSDPGPASPGSWLIDDNATPANILTLGGTAPTITVNALATGETATISAAIVGNTRINKDGTGTLVLAGANTHTSGMFVTAGVVIMNNAAANVGGSTSTSNFEVRSTAAFRQSAGKITVVNNNNANINSGTNTFVLGNHDQFGNTPTYGAYELSGGILEINNPWRMNVRRGQITQTGGELNINYTGTGAIAAGREFLIGSFKERAVGYATAGTTTITTSAALTGAALVISDTGNSHNPNGSDLTIANSADWTVSGGAGLVHITRGNSLDNDRETGNLNLNNGGRLTTNGIAQGDSNAGAIGRLNFNGGTLRAGSDNTTFLEGLTSTRIYSGGATIDTNAKNITIDQDLESPIGDGLGSIAITDGGSGYIGAPLVTITGGEGNGATAVANFDAATGTVTGITITNPGSEYTTPPSVTIDHGFQSGGTAASLGDVTLSAFTSGGLTKIGSGTLTLSGNSTYTGATTVDEGTLAVTGSLDATNIEVKNNATLAGGGLMGGNVTIRSGGRQAFEVAETAEFQTTRTITGALNLEAGTIIELTAATPPAPGGPYVLLTAAGGITGTPGSIILNGISGSIVQNGNNLEFTVTAASGFASWAATPAFGLATEDQDPTDDPDNDGINNLLEYVLNGNPGASSTNILPAADNSDPTDLIFTFSRREESAEDTNQVFQYSTDLSGWTAISITGTPGAEVTLAPPALGLQLVTVKIPKSAATPSGKLFGRLQVTQP